MTVKTLMSHEERVQLYVRIIESQKLTLSDYNVALMRNGAPGQRELDALNDALKQLGWER